MGKVVYMTKVPDCDFCLKQDDPGPVLPAIVDGPTVFGSHAYMCESHRRRWARNGWMPPGEDPLENPLALEQPLVMPSDEERAATMAEFMADPPMDRIHDMMFDVILCEAVDGCTTDPSGTCEHGYPSMLKALDIM